MLLTCISAVVGIITGLVLLIGIVLGFARNWIVPPWQPSLRKWIQTEVISLLKNDDTPVAVYAHQAQDAAEAARAEATALHEDVKEMRVDIQVIHEDIRETNKLLMQHIMSGAV